MALISKQDTKDNVYPHTQAKLDLYRNYLFHYLRVLGLSPYCSKINLFDIFCGMGIYKDGKIGSPIITNNCVRETNEIISGIGKQIKPISININDYEKEKIDSVKSILEVNKNVNCHYEYHNLDANDMLDIVSTKVNSYASTERSLVFIDPYGYSQINSSKIYNLIKNERTEIILFLPVMQMYRFAEIALSNPEDRLCYENLRRFILSFFPTSHKIHSDGIKSVFEFIHEVKIALSFQDKFYTCSHYIERGKNNYYAIFFITSNIYGLDKMVEAKWKLDPIKGKGFTQKRTATLFDDQFEVTDNSRQLDFFKNLIIEKLKEKGLLSNNSLYELSLRNEFRPAQAKTVLDDLLKSSKIDICNLRGEQISNVGAYYMDYTHFKNKENKVYFKIK